MTHANAPLTPVGRQRLAELIVVHGWPVRRAAERFQVLAGHGVEVGRALPRGPADDATALPAALLTNAGRRRAWSAGS